MAATKQGAANRHPSAYMPRLKQRYRQEVVPALQKQFGLRNTHQVPRLDKIVINVGVGRHKDDKSYTERARNNVAKITGQQPVDRMAKKSVANYKIRARQNLIGLSVTLRGQRMYEFLDRLVNIALPRVRDFHGVKPGAFDKSGNFSLGVAEQSIFPELNFEDTQVLHGLQVNIAIKSQSPEQSKALLEALGMPFEDKENT